MRGQALALFPPAYQQTAGRDRLDRYYTPAAVAEACVSWLPIEDAAQVLEPHGGGGAFWRALVRKGHAVDVLDVDPMAPVWDCQLHQPGGPVAPRRHVQEFLSWTPGKAFHWVIGNPPYRDAELHVRKALEVSRRHVCFLLRLGFLESQERFPFWSSSPLRHVFVLSRRPSFDGMGTDATAYGFFWWDHLHQGPGTLSVESWT